MRSRKNGRVNEEKEDCVVLKAHKWYKANHSACEVCVRNQLTTCEGFRAKNLCAFGW